MTALATGALALAAPDLADDERVVDDVVDNDDDQRQHQHHEQNDDHDDHDDDDRDDDDDHHDDESTNGDEAAETLAHTTPVAASAEPIALPSLDPVAVQPVFAGLASIIPAKGTLLLAIAKLASADLRVTVQPPPAPDEPAESVLPLTVTGTVTLAVLEIAKRMKRATASLRRVMTQTDSHVLADLSYFTHPALIIDHGRDQSLVYEILDERYQLDVQDKGWGPGFAIVLDDSPKSVRRFTKALQALKDLSSAAHDLCEGMRGFSMLAAEGK